MDFDFLPLVNSTKNFANRINSLLENSLIKIKNFNYDRSLKRISARFPCLQTLTTLSPPVFGLDITSSAVKLLALSQKESQYHVESYGTVSLPPGAIVENDIKNVGLVANAIKKVIEQSGTSLKHAAISIPGSLVITKVIELDTDFDEDETEVQVEMAVSRYIPYPMSEVSFDFQILEPSSNQGKKKILVIATRQTNIDTRVNVLTEAGVVPEIVDVEPYTVQNAVSFFRGQLPRVSEKSVVAIVDIGATFTTLTVLNNDRVIYTREEVFGGEQLILKMQQRYGLTVQQAQLAIRQRALPENYETDILTPFYESLIPLMRRSLEFFFSTSQYPRIDQMILAGGVAMSAGLRQIIEQQLGITTIVANPFLNMTLSPLINEKELAVDVSAMLLCCGLAMRSVSEGE